MSSSHIRRVVNSSLAERPLFLSTIGHELHALGISSTLESHLYNYLNAASIRDLWSHILQRWMRSYSWTVDADDNATHRGKLPNVMNYSRVKMVILNEVEVITLPGAWHYDGRKGSRGRSMWWQWSEVKMSPA